MAEPHKDPFLNSTDAQRELDRNDLLPSASRNKIKPLGLEGFVRLVRMTQLTHPDLSTAQACDWVYDHAVRIHFKETGPTLEELYRGGTDARQMSPHKNFLFEKIDDVAFHPDFLPLLGTHSQIEKKQKIIGAQPKSSVRALAAKYDIDPEYALSFTEDSIRKLTDFVAQSPLFSFDGYYSNERFQSVFQPIYADMAEKFRASFREKFGEPLPEELEPLERAARKQAKQIMAKEFVEHVFAEPVTGERPDYMLSSIGAALLNFPHVAKAHRRELTVKDYGEMTPESMHEALQTKEPLEDPVPQVSDIERFERPLSQEEQRAAALKKSRG